MIFQSGASEGEAGDARGTQASADPANGVDLDLVGILDTVDLPIVIIGRDRLVARYNRSAATLLGLKSANVGRSLSTVSMLAHVKDLDRLCVQVLTDGGPCRKEIRYGDRWWFVRIAPYLGPDRRIEAAVLTFTNVTAFRASVEQAICEREYTKTILNTVIEPLVVLDSQCRVQTANRAFYELFRISREQAHGMSIVTLEAEGWDSPCLQGFLTATLSTHEFQTLEIESTVPAIGLRTFALRSRRFSTEAPGPMILLAIQDITDRRRAEVAVLARNRQLFCLHGLADAVNRAEALTDLYERALESILAALRADRASILLLDDEGVMRFAAWRGLSERYRLAVEGHSPWLKDTIDPKPIVVGNMTEAGLPSSLQDVLCEEGIQALAFIPLTNNGRLLGKCMVYFNRPYTLNKEETVLAQAISGTLALGIERKTAEARLRLSEERLTMELADTKLLQRISAELILEEDIEALYATLMSSASAIMRSDAASLQMLYPERGSGGELRLLACRGFSDEAARFWEWVKVDSASACGAALRTGERVIVPDVQTCEFMAGSDDLATCRQTGIGAVQTTPLKSRTGKIVGMISTHWNGPYHPSEREMRLFDILARQAADLIERKQAEDALRDSERRYRATFQNAGIGIAHVGLDGRWLRCNDAVCSITGYSREELQSKTFADVTHPDDIALDWKNAQRLIGGEITIYTRAKRYIHKRGGLVWINVTVSLLRDEAGTPLHFITTIEDVTDQKQAELAVRSSEERYRSLYASMDEGFCIIEVVFDAHQHPVDFIFLEVNPSFEKQTGIADARGRKMRDIAPNHEEHWFALFGEIALTGKSKRFEYAAAELHRWYEGYAYRLGEAGERKVATIFNDITHRKQAEQELRRLASDLELRVAERTHELLDSQARLRGLATDLNLAEQRERKRIASELHDYLAQLLVLVKMKLGQGKRFLGENPACAEFIKQAEDVLGQALTYTRTLVADLSPSVLHDFGLPAALRWLGNRMAQQQLSVTTYIEVDHVALPEDQAVLLFQSVRELLINTAKHAQTGHAEVRMAQRQGRLQIEVQDHGIGFDPEAAAATSGPSSCSSQYGLFSIRERMIALGGWFQLQSAPGQGTMARLTLPLGGGQSPTVSERSEPESARRSACQSPLPALHSPLPIHESPVEQERRTRVLLVDDHAMVRQGLRSVLESYADMEVVGEAANGEEAIAGVEQWQPAIVVMDINMPTMNGIEATAIIKARYPQLAVVGLSVNANAEAQDAMMQAGAAMLLTKEAAVDELYRAIQEILVQA